jgi:fatty-acyl-CoA synthase
MNLAERAEYFGRWQPEAVAIRAGERDVTWSELRDSVAWVARGLRELGIAPGDRVGILGANSVEWCVLALAAMHCGGVLVPLNIRLAPPELTMIIEHSGCRAVAVDETFESLLDRAELGADVLQISLDGTAAGVATVSDLAGSQPAEIVPRADDDPAIIGYTSGTTGLPKGVILTHRNVDASSMQTAYAEGSMKQRRTLLCIPLAFTGGVVNNFMATYTVGGTLVLHPAFVPDQVIELLESERITTWFAVPIMWQAVAATAAFAAADLSHLSTAICGGSTVPRPLLEAYHTKGVAIRQAYGLTEATGSTCLLPVELHEHPTAAGMANLHTELRIFDDEQHELPTGEVGEIVVRGPQVMAGYWNDPKASAEAITPDGWLLTGDMGRVDKRGLLEVVDRKKSMFISGGLNVYPAEVERVVDTFPGVVESAAFGLTHERFGEACAIVVVSSRPLDEEALIQHCRAQLADYKSPRSVVVVDEPLPRGMSGKILRNEVPARFAAGSAASTAAVA